MLLALRALESRGTAGIKQPGGPGTTIFVYDNALSANALYYTMTEISAAFPRDIEALAGIVSDLGLTTRRQYICHVGITLGGQSADGFNATTFQESDCDIEFRSGGIARRVGGGAITLKLGVKVGSPPAGLKRATMGGTNGVTYMGPGLTLGNDFFIYGCTFNLSGTLTWNNASAVTQELAGNTFNLKGSNNVLGSGTTVGVCYNNTFNFMTSAGPVNGCLTQDSDGNVYVVNGGNACLAIPSSQSSLRSKNAIFSGVPTVADIRVLGVSYSDVILMAPTPTGNAPLFFFSQNATAATAAKICQAFNTRICDNAGLPLANIPVMLVDQVLGSVVVDTISFTDGDLGFIGAGGYQNGVVVQDWYNSAGVLTKRDRKFTLYVNRPGSPFGYQPDPNYGSFETTFEWPGKVSGILTAAIIPVELGYAFALQASLTTSGSLLDRASVPMTATETVSASIAAQASVYQLFLAQLELAGGMEIPSGSGPPVITEPGPYFEEDDIAAMLEGAGQDVALGASLAKGLFTERDVVLRDDDGVELIAKVPVAVVQTSALPGLAIGAQLSIDARTFRVWKLKQIDDGALSEASLQVV